VAPQRPHQARSVEAKQVGDCEASESSLVLRRREGQRERKEERAATSVLERERLLVAIMGGGHTHEQGRMDHERLVCAAIVGTDGPD
jgi:hypothetical protein